MHCGESCQGLVTKSLEQSEAGEKPLRLSSFWHPRPALQSYRPLPRIAEARDRRIGSGQLFGFGFLVEAGCHRGSLLRRCGRCWSGERRTR